MHDLQRWSEDEVTAKKKRNLNTQLPKNLQLPKSLTQQTTGARHKVIKLAKDQLNVGYKGIPTTKDPHNKKKIEKVARKKIRIATKLKSPQTFEQKIRHWTEKS